MSTGVLGGFYGVVEVAACGELVESVVSGVEEAVVSTTGGVELAVGVSEVRLTGEV